MTNEEIEKILEGTNRIKDKLTKKIDLSEISFDPYFMSALTGDLLNSELKKVENELAKYEKMRLDFLEKASAMVHSITRFPKMGGFKIKNMKNYYILSCSDIVDFHLDNYYGSFFGIFDKKGNPIDFSEFKETIMFEDENNYFIETFTEDHIVSYCHKRLEQREWKTVSNFKGCIRAEQLNSQLIRVYQRYSPYGADNEFNVYNKKIGKMVLENVNGISPDYKNWKNFEPDNFYLVTKVITDVKNTATLNFFIDLEGNLVSDVFDIDRAHVYPIEKSQNQIESLEKVYTGVVLNLKRENQEKEEFERKRTSIYELKRKKKVEENV